MTFMEFQVGIQNIRTDTFYVRSEFIQFCNSFFKDTRKTLEAECNSIFDRTNFNAIFTLAHNTPGKQIAI